MRISAKESERGGVILEFAIVVPLLVLFISMIVDLGRLFQERATLQEAARAGARAAAMFKISQAYPTGNADLNVKYKHAEGAWTAEDYLGLNGLDPANYDFQVVLLGEDKDGAVDRYGNPDRPEGNRIALTISSRPGRGRSIFLPGRFLRACVGASFEYAGGPFLTSGSSVFGYKQAGSEPDFQRIQSTSDYVQDCTPFR